MKLLFLIFSLVPLTLLSQNTTDGKLFLNAFGEQTIEKDHKFFRIVKDYFIEKDNYKIFEYYKSGVLRMAGNSLNKDRLEKEGQFVSYYENGKKESIKNYSRGKQMGKQYNWYPSGLIKSETDFLDGDIYHNASFKIIQFWDINANHKVIDGNGIYETKNEDFFETGQILNGLKNGQWKGAENNYTFIENYLDGNFIDGTSTDSNNIDRKYSSINTMGGFKKGSKHFYNFFPIHFIKPSEAKLNNIAGKTFVTFIIGENGKLGDLNLINKIGFGIDEEVVRVLKKYKDWTPYTKRGIPENILHSIGVIVE